jgi:hypothetical protein
MGNYNPHLPFILGMEWVPIREEDLVLSNRTNNVEIGHSFALKVSRQIGDARHYVNALPPDPWGEKHTMISIYDEDREALSGPIKQVIIPCNAGGATGMGVTLPSVTIAAALYESGDGNLVPLTAFASAARVDAFFSVNEYPILQGKRILNVSLVYTGNATDLDPDTGDPIPYVNPDPVGAPLTVLTVRNDFNTESSIFQKFKTANTGSLWELSTVPDVNANAYTPGQIYAYVNLGDVTIFRTGADTPLLPWRFIDLQRFEASNPSRIFASVAVNIPVATPDVTVNLDYMALRVLFVEENRVGLGVKTFSDFGTNDADLFVPTTYAANPTLSPGRYSVLISSVSPGDIFNGQGFTGSFPKLNALRELYALPPQNGVQVNIPFPPEDHLGDVFTREQTHILPQLSIHDTSNEPINEPHVYGRQARAEVWGSNKLEQDIWDDDIPPTFFQQVRFYARRFGDTTVPLMLTPTGSSVPISGAAVITPEEFDELPEILDGWKEVTLRFTTPVQMGQLAIPTWRFFALNELPGSRWELIGAIAPALNATVGSTLTQVASAQRLTPATYQPTSGFGDATDEMDWIPGYAPLVTASVGDNSADLVLMFSQDPALITGFGVTSQTQELVGINLECGSLNCCVPTGIKYNRLSWGFPLRSTYAIDTFSRVAVSGWGNADLGGTWTIGNLSGNAGQFSVNGSQGVIAPTTTGVSRYIVLGSNVAGLGIDFDVTADLTIVNNVTTGFTGMGIVGRYTDDSNLYLARLERTTTTQTMALYKIVGGSATKMREVNIPYQMGPETTLRLRFMGYGEWLKAKVWRPTDPEPEGWDIEHTDFALTTGSRVGFNARTDDTDGTIRYDNFTLTPPAYWQGSIELQRLDELTDWQTIMLATSPAVTSFNDYEARVGINSVYRIRNNNVYNFHGPWSAQVTGFIDPPGVTGGDCLDEGHVLIFTSNEEQDGSRNLAYSNAWEAGQTVEEGFVFPEAGFTQLQAMYNRDFFTVFRPTERGGEQFERDILVNASAIDPETLANFTSLRDMAWDSLPYICVRDEDGNRWFAAVQVPAGRVLRNRRLYLAPIGVIEVTDTSSPVDKSPP